MAIGITDTGGKTRETFIVVLDDTKQDRHNALRKVESYAKTSLSSSDLNIGASKEQMENTRVFELGHPSCAKGDPKNSEEEKREGSFSSSERMHVYNNQELLTALNAASKKLTEEKPNLIVLSDGDMKLASLFVPVCKKEKLFNDPERLLHAAGCHVKGELLNADKQAGTVDWSDLAGTKKLIEKWKEAFNKIALVMISGGIRDTNVREQLGESAGFTITNSADLSELRQAKISKLDDPELVNLTTFLDTCFRRFQEEEPKNLVEGKPVEEPVNSEL